MRPLARRAFALVVLAPIAAAGAPDKPAPDKPAAGPDKAACIQAFDEGQDLRKEGKLLGARDKLLACASPSCPKLVRADCLKAAESIEGEVPSIVVKVQRDGVDATDATITIDAKPVPLDGKPLLLDPGPHTVLVTVAGLPPTKQTVVLATGEKNRVVTVTMEPSKATPSQPPPVGPVAPTTPAASRPVWPWFALGLGAVALGGSAILGLGARSDYQRLEGSCAPRCDDGEVSSVRRRFLFADLALGVGVVAVGFGVVGLVRGAGERPPSVSLSIGPGVAFATYGARF